MDTSSILLVLGLAYLAIGVGLLLSPRFYKQVIDRFINNEGILFLVGAFALVIGFLLLVFKDTGAGGLANLINVMGGLSILKGVVILAIPEKTCYYYRKVQKKLGDLKYVGVAVIILGLILLGFSSLA